jgi:hypothetical protein
LPLNFAFHDADADHDGDSPAAGTKIRTITLRRRQSPIGGDPGPGASASQSALLSDETASEFWSDLARWSPSSQHDASSNNSLRKATVKVVMGGPSLPTPTPGGWDDLEGPVAKASVPLSPFHVVVDVDHDGDDETESQLSVSVVSDIAAGLSSPMLPTFEPTRTKSAKSVNAGFFSESAELLTGHLLIRERNEHFTVSETKPVDPVGREIEDDFGYLDEIEGKIGELAGMVSRDMSPDVLVEAIVNVNKTTAAMVANVPSKLPAPSRVGEITIERIPQVRNIGEATGIPNQKVLLEGLAGNDFKQELLANVRRKQNLIDAEWVSS